MLIVHWGSKLTASVTTPNMFEKSVPVSEGNNKLMGIPSYTHVCGRSSAAIIRELTYNSLRCGSEQDSIASMV